MLRKQTNHKIKTRLLEREKMLQNPICKANTKSFSNTWLILVNYFVFTKVDGNSYAYVSDKVYSFTYIQIVICHYLCDLE